MTSDERRDQLRRRLEQERARLLAVRDGVEEGLSGDSESSSISELSDADQHPADVGTETFNRERDTAIVESVDGELDDVRRALERLDRGTYGICIACGRPIPPERLEALPATPFCAEDSRMASAQAAPGLAGPSGAAPGTEERGTAI